MKYSIMTLFLQPIHSIISHFISAIVFTPYSLIHRLYFNYSPNKQKFVKEAEVSEVQVAYDHPFSVNFLSFPLSSEKKKKTAWSQLSIENSMFSIQTASEQISVLSPYHLQNRKVL